MKLSLNIERQHVVWFVVQCHSFRTAYQGVALVLYNKNIPGSKHSKLLHEQSKKCLLQESVSPQTLYKIKVCNFLK